MPKMHVNKISTLLVISTEISTGTRENKVNNDDIINAYQNLRQLEA